MSPTIALAQETASGASNISSEKHRQREAVAKDQEKLCGSYFLLPISSIGFWMHALYGIGDGMQLAMKGWLAVVLRAVKVSWPEIKFRSSDQLQAVIYRAQKIFINFYDITTQTLRNERTK